jgi:hypothetical protein
LNRCPARFAWSRQLDPVDADSSTIRLTLTAEGHPVTVAGAPQVQVRGPRSSPRTGTLLTCPGVGTAIDVRYLDVDLDAGVVEYLPNGNTGPSEAMPALSVAPGEPAEVLDVTAHTNACDCDWRLVFTVSHEGGGTETVTVPDDGTWFRSSSLNALRYEFFNNDWQLLSGPDATGAVPESPPAPPNACTIVTAADVAAVLSAEVDELAPPTELGGGAPSESGRQINISSCTRPTLDGSRSVGADVIRAVHGFAEDEFNVIVRHSEEDGQELSDALTARTDRATRTTNGVIGRAGDLVASVSVSGSGSLTAEQYRLLEREVSELLAAG